MNKRQRMFAGVERLMASHRPMITPEGEQGGGGAAILELPAEQVGTKEELGVFVKQTARALAQLSKGPSPEALKQVEKDLKAALDGAKEFEQRLARTEEMARNAARTAPEIGKIGLEALKTIPCQYEVDHDFRAYMGRGQYNVLNLSKGELENLDEPVKKFVERFRLLHDTIAIADAYLAATSRGRDYFARGGMKSLRVYGQYEDMAKQLKAAMDTSTTGEGLEWVPRGVGVSLIEDIRPELNLAAMIPTIPMPRNPYVYPVQGVHFKANKVAESTGNSGNTAINKKDLSTIKLNFDAVKLAAMLLTSSELEEDSIVPLISAIRADLAFAVAAAIEDADLNGQLTAVIDSADSPASDNCRAAWDGLRYAASLTGVSYDFGAGLIVEGLTSIKGQMGKFGIRASDGFWATGYAGWAKMLTLKDSSGQSLVLTQEKVGAIATVLTGVLGVLLGSPIVVCDDYPQAMGGSGLNDGSGVDRTGLLYVNRKGFRMGEVRLSLIEASRDWAFDVDQIAFRVTYRGQMKAVRTPVATTWAVAGMGRNLPTN